MLNVLANRLQDGLIWWLANRLRKLRGGYIAHALDITVEGWGPLSTWTLWDDASGMWRNGFNVGRRTVLSSAYPLPF